MSKKFVLIIACAVVAGASSALIVQKATERTDSTPKVIELKEGSSYHFTSNESGTTNYPDLTYAAEHTVPAVVNRKDRIG